MLGKNIINSARTCANIYLHLYFLTHNNICTICLFYKCKWKKCLVDTVLIIVTEFQTLVQMHWLLTPLCFTENSQYITVKMVAHVRPEYYQSGSYSLLVLLHAVIVKQRSVLLGREAERSVNSSDCVYAVVYFCYSWNLSSVIYRSSKFSTTSIGNGSLPLHIQICEVYFAFLGSVSSKITQIFFREVACRESATEWFGCLGSSKDLCKIILYDILELYITVQCIKNRWHVALQCYASVVLVMKKHKINSRSMVHS